MAAVLDLTAVGLVMCALHLTAAATFEALAFGTRFVAWRVLRRAVPVVATLLLAAALIEVRWTYVSALDGRDDHWVGAAVLRAVGLFWHRLATVSLGCGLAAWALGVGSWELGVNPLATTRAHGRS